MNYYSFENLKMDVTGHYDLFQKTMVNIPTSSFDTFVVTQEFQGRLDLVCRFIHGSTDYLEELMTINHIINPYSLKVNTIILYFSDSNNYQMLYQSDLESNDKKDEILSMNNNKTTKKDKNRVGSPPTIKPDNLKQIDVNHTKRKITILNKFK
jgi:hypothetical protein